MLYKMVMDWLELLWSDMDWLVIPWICRTNSHPQNRTRFSQEPHRSELVAFLLKEEPVSLRQEEAAIYFSAGHMKLMPSMFECQVCNELIL